MINYLVDTLILKPALGIKPSTKLEKILQSLAEYKLMTPADMVAAKAIGVPIKLFYK